MDLALFDFDGTITRTGGFSGTDSFSRFVHSAVRPSRMLIGWALLGPLVLGYRLKWISASRVRRAVVRIGFWRESASRVRELGCRFATQVLPSTVRPHALERIRWHQRRGDAVVVVSAALDVYLQPWCVSEGLQCVCTELEERDGLLTGRYRSADCTGAEKARRIEARFVREDYGQVYAYGDTEEDAQLLELAGRRYYRWREVESGSERTPADSAG